MSNSANNCGFLASFEITQYSCNVLEKLPGYDLFIYINNMEKLPLSFSKMSLLLIPKKTGENLGKV
jgi:hypothetical protein